jgi:hypothetical protein
MVSGALVSSVAWGLVVTGLMSGCAPGTPDEDSWRVDAIRAVSNVSSAVGTMQLALQQHDRITDPYLKVVAVNAEDGASKAADKLSSRQPPRAYRSRYDKVTTALDNAETLLSDARIAVVNQDEGDFPKLAQQLSKKADRLQQIEAGLHALPDDRTKP